MSQLYLESTTDDQAAAECRQASCTEDKERKGTESSSQGFEDWVLNEQPDEYELQWDSDAVDDFLLSRMESYFNATLDRLYSLAGEGKFSPNSVDSSGTIFETVAHDFLLQQRLLCCQILSKKARNPVSKKEFLLFVGLYLLGQLLPFDYEDILFQTTAVLQAQNRMSEGEFIPMNQSRFQEILDCISCGAEQNHCEGREGIDEVDKNRDFEKNTYHRSQAIFISKSLNFVIDDELVLSRPNSIQSKALSKSMARKEKVWNNAIAECYSNVFLAVRRNQPFCDHGVVQDLIFDTVEPDRSKGAFATASREHSSEELWKLLASRDLSFLMIADRAEHPFLQMASVKCQLSKRKKQKRTLQASSQVSHISDSPPSQRRVTRPLRAFDMKGPRNSHIGKVRDGPAADELVKEEAENFSIVSDKRFVIDDHPFMGCQIFTAKALVTVGDGSSYNPPTPVTAIAFTDYTVKAKGQANMLRFVECNTGLQEKLERTVCMERLRFSDQRKVSTCVLFFPCKESSTDRLEAEAAVLKAATPLTCSQRCADWYIQRMFVVTAACAGAIARREPLTRRWTCESANNNQPNNAEQDARVESSDFVQAGTNTSHLGEEDERGDMTSFKNQSFADDALKELECDADSSDDEDIHWQYEEYSEEDLNEEEDSEEDSSCYELRYRPERNVDAFDDELGQAELSDEQNRSAIAKLLFQSWIFNRDSSTKPIKSGSRKVEHVFVPLRKKLWCKRIFEVGLVRSKSHPYLAASSDAIVLAQNPGEFRAPPQYMSCEIQTNISPRLAPVVSNVRQKYGDVFTCVVGDFKWWEAVPAENRARIIHHAVVLNMDCLFVVADKSNIQFCCFVKVPDMVREDHVSSLSKYSDLMTWALHSVDSAGPPPDVPMDFDADARKSLTSHLRLWRAVSKEVAKGAPLHPVRTFKSLAEVLYNSVNGGNINSPAHFAETFSNSKLQLKEDQLFALRSLNHLVMNSFLLYRLKKMRDESEGLKKVETVKHLLARLNATISLPKFVNMLALKFVHLGVRRGITLKDNDFGSSESRKENKNGVSETSRKRGRGSPAEKLDNAFSEMPTQRQAVIEHFNKSDCLTALRLAGYHNYSYHEMCTSGKKRKQKRCVLCGLQTTTSCAECQVALHITNTGGKSKSCSYQWHSMTTLKMLNPTLRASKKQ